MSIYDKDDGIDDSFDPHLEQQRLDLFDNFPLDYLEAEEYSNNQDMAMGAINSLQSEESRAFNSETQNTIDLYSAQDEMMNDAYDINLDY